MRGDPSRAQFSSVAQSCPSLCDSVDCSTPGLPVHHQLPESTQTHGHCVRDAIQSSHPLSSPSLPAFSLSQHQGLFQRVFFASGGQSILKARISGSFLDRAGSYNQVGPEGQAQMTTDKPTTPLPSPTTHPPTLLAARKQRQSKPRYRTARKTKNWFSYP